MTALDCLAPAGLTFEFLVPCNDSCGCQLVLAHALQFADRSHGFLYAVDQSDQRFPRLLREKVDPTSGLGEHFGMKLKSSSADRSKALSLDSPSVTK